MSENQEPAPGRKPPVRKMSRRRWALAGLAVIVAGFWFGHSPLLSWAGREAAMRVAEHFGCQVDIGRLRIHLAEPVLIENVHFRVTNPPASRTDLTLRRAQVSLNSLWKIAFEDGRVFRDARIDDFDGVFDFRIEAIIPMPMPTLSRAEQENISATILRFLPLAATFDGADLVFLADDQSYTVTGVSARLSESERGYLRVARTLIEAGSIRQEILAGEAITAWRNGAVYVAGLQLRPEIRLDQLVANLVNPGGVAMSAEAEIHGGSLRGDIAFGAKNDLIHIDAAVSVANVPVEPLPELLAIPALAEGVIRNGQFTFRGNPERIVDAEISLRVAADSFEWNGRGWKSLVVGANLIGRKLYVPEFSLTQSENSIQANGEMAIRETWEETIKAPFLLNVTASVQDLTELATLVNPAFHEVKGRLSLHGSLNGEGGDMRGYLNAEASGVELPGLFEPLSAKIQTVVRNREVQVPYAEICSGNDRVAATGAIGIPSPHPYSGELNLSVEDLGIYTALAGPEAAAMVFTGSAEAHWTGDGTMAAHSGAFTATLRNVITAVTPTGITGEFEGTYSPENIYLALARLEHGAFVLNSRLTLSAAGVNLMDADLRHGSRPLLTADAFLPINVFAFARGGTPAEAIQADEELYIRASSAELPVADLMHLAGQEAAFHGTLRLNLTAEGTIADPSMDGSLTGRNLSAVIEGVTLPTSSLDLKLANAEGKATLRGSLQTRGFNPVALSAEMPYAFEKRDDGSVQWFDSNAPISAVAEFPKTGIAVFQPFLPKFRRLAGTVSGRFALDGTLQSPRMDGHIELIGGSIDVAVDTPRISGLNGLVRFDGSRVVVDRLRGEIAAGPFEASGVVDLSDPRNPAIRLSLKGDKILLARTPAIRLRANVNLEASGDSNRGSLTGSISLVDGRIYKRIEITPLLAPSPLGEDVMVVPSFAGLVPLLFGTWSVDVKIRNESPFLLVGNVAEGEISPQIDIKGTLGNPFAVGTVAINNLQAFLPFTTLTVNEGQINFTEENPFMPELDVRGYAETGGYNVQAYAYGPLSDRKLVLRSDPPLSQEQLLLLLTTGIAPGAMSGAGFGEAAAGQGGLFLLRGLARQIEPFGVDLREFVNRLSIAVLPPRDPTQSTSLVSEFRLIDGFSLGTGRDGYGFYNAGFIYTLRFR
jgi:autotransporter translocation and assembly factor TamB